MSMNEDIKRFPIVGLNPNGAFVPIWWIGSTADYDHSTYHIQKTVTTLQ